MDNVNHIDRSVFPIKSNTSTYGGLTLPGYNYIGPGNKIFNEIPKNNPDLIAQIHDIEYHNIISRALLNNVSKEEFISSVRTADEKASNSFATDWNTTGHWGSLIGYLGLRAKIAVEKVFGIIYPSKYQNT